MKHIRLDLPKKFVEEVPQRIMIEKSFDERREYFIHPLYIYMESFVPDEYTGEPICWVISDPLHSWLKGYGLGFEDIMIGLLAVSQRINPQEGWQIWLPADIATLYKLTWL